MINVTDDAAAKLKTLILEHPEDPIVRLIVSDVDDQRIQFTIMLDSDPQPNDEVQECNGLTVAVEGGSVTRTDGMTLDYNEAEGYKFLHPEPGDQDFLRLINPN